MIIGAIIHGFILALGLILPLGVQNLFVFNQGTAHSRFVKVLPASITASLCDTLLISVAVMGVSVVVLEYSWIKVVLYSLGICFLVYMGFTTWRSKAVVPSAAKSTFTTKKQIAFALSVSLLNPSAVVDIIGVVGMSSMQYEGWDKIAFMAACIVVSWLWFIGLGIAGHTIGRLDQTGRLLAKINIISAIIMWSTAAYLGCNLFLG